MGRTPEGEVKDVLRALLALYTPIHTYWPVPSGFGKATIDVIGCYRGRFFAVETKARGKKPTLRQEAVLQEIGMAMGRTFVMSGPQDPEFDRLRQWLDYQTEYVGNDPHLTSDQTRRRAL